MQRSSIIVAAGPAAFIASVALAGPVPIPAEVVIAEGDAIAGDVVDIINGVEVSGNDTVGFNASLLTSGDRFVWVGDGPVVFNSDFKPDVTGAEASIGVSDAGNYVYSPSVNGNDSVIFDDGFIVSETQPSFDGVPGFITFNSRPFMTDGGVGYWISGYNASDPDGSTQGRVFYRYDGTSVTAVTVAGDSFEYEGNTFIIDLGGAIDFDFHVSAGDVNVIQVVDAAGESPANDNIVLINGEGVYREGEPNGTGDNWDNFDIFRIEDDGDHIFTGDTDGPTDSDEFIAVNGEIVIREGMMLDGVLLESGFTLRGLDLAPNGTVVHAWGSGDVEVVFVGSISDLAGTSTRLLSVGDVLDLGDGGLVTIVDLEASTILPGDLAVSDEAVYANLDVENGLGATFEIIARFPLSSDFPCPADLDDSGDVTFDDLLVVLSAFGGSGPLGDVNESGTVDFDDVLAVLSAFGPCP